MIVIMQNSSSVNFLQASYTEVVELFSQPNAYRSVLILIVCIVIAYWLSKFIAKAIVVVAQKVAIQSDSETDQVKAVKLRQVETYLGVFVAIARALIVAVVAYVAWRVLSPESSQQIGGSGAAAIGASAFFIVFAGQTLGILLRDITAGATMIAERWFNVGDYIKVEPFWDVKGVVERLTLRSTRLRSISGEVIWIHNQQISAVHVTPNGVRTMAVDVFVSDETKGEAFVSRVIKTLPTGPTMLVKPPEITATERWGEGVWRITVLAKVAPGRDWLIDKYFISSLESSDEKKPKASRLMVRPPIARWADEVAERRFSRAVRMAKR
ncbi:TPA: hypothetical protein DIV49_00815 [Candidatus Saccharibacteria bacterium]|nr:hypothetical protein [Candidatus Saccharibacteria bacterium]HRJ91348.1 mechanosensitive ion channel [Candidatus Saccharibacteria bacterium]